MDGTSLSKHRISVGLCTSLLFMPLLREMIKWTDNEIAKFEALTAILRNSCLTVCWYASFIWEKSERLSIKFWVSLCIKFWFASLFIVDVLRRLFSFSATKPEPQVRIQLYKYMYVSDFSAFVLPFQMGQLPVQEVL